MEQDNENSRDAFGYGPFERSPRSRTTSPEREPVDNETMEITKEQFYHFKIQHDPTYNYKEICAKVFTEDKPYLAIIEKVDDPQVHVHFQGTSRYAERSIKNYLAELAKKHWRRKFKPRCHPTSMKARKPDVVGFQYMCKTVEPQFILAMNLFTMEDIFEMKANSTMVVEERKTTVKNFIEQLPKDAIDKLIYDLPEANRINEMCKRAAILLRDADEAGEIKMPDYNKFHTRNTVIRGLLANKNLPKPIWAELYSS